MFLSISAINKPTEAKSLDEGYFRISVKTALNSSNYDPIFEGLGRAKNSKRLRK